MEVYILDSLYRRIAVIDRYKSLTWAERFAAKGDFILEAFSTLENRTRFTPGVRLAQSESYRVMTIETVEDTVDAEGAALLRISGYSLEYVMELRLAMAALTDLETDAKWTIEDTPKAIATQLFHDICVTGILDAGDIIAGVTEANIFEADTIPEPVDDVVYSFDPKSLYEATKDICDAFAMGFRLVRDQDSAMLYYDVYMGSDRTTSQTVLPAVVFSPDLENLRTTRKLTSTAIYKNVAYVVSSVGHEVVYPTDVDPTVAGFDRRVLFVNASDINDPDGPTASAQMIQRGKDELAKNRRFVALDGELASSSRYRYGRDYNLGDLVELRNADGVTSNMQVTEQIFTSDAQGDRSFPTLAIDTFITPGSWLAWDYNQEWDDLTTEHWDELE